MNIAMKTCAWIGPVVLVARGAAAVGPIRGDRTSLILPTGPTEGGADGALDQSADSAADAGTDAAQP
jgi:hypothetical protein